MAKVEFLTMGNVMTLRLPAIRIGRNYRFYQEEIEERIEKWRVGTDFLNLSASLDTTIKEELQKER